ncbi:MAG: flagellar motor switch protein FliN [Planctomycetota bacterium]
MAEEQDAPQPTGEPPAEAAADPEAANAALQAAQAAVNAINAEATSAGDPAETEPSGAVPAAFAPPAFEPAEAEELPKGLDLLSDVDVNVTIELGRTRMLVEDVLRLAEGAVVELDKLAGDPVDVFVNERLVARGEVLVLNDNFCIRVNEILDADAVEDD